MSVHKKKNSHIPLIHDFSPAGSSDQAVEDAVLEMNVTPSGGNVADYVHHANSNGMQMTTKTSPKILSSSPSAPFLRITSRSKSGEYVRVTRVLGLGLACPEPVVDSFSCF